MALNVEAMTNDQKQLLTPVQTLELERRLRTLDADIEDGVTWEELKAELEQRRLNPLTIR
jgi:hypothetical protein